MEKPFVLLIDDNEATTTLITAILHKEFDVDVAADGTDALEKLRTKNYRAIVLDLLMPQLDGYGVLDFLRNNHPEVLKSVLVVSAALSRKEMARVREYHVCEIISKPFEVDHLIGAVRRCAGLEPGPRATILTSGMLLLLADLLRQRWM